MKRKTKIVPTAEEARRKARKQIIAVIIIGTVLLLMDMMTASARPQVAVTEADGRLYMVRPSSAEEAGRLSLIASVSGEHETVEKKVDIMLEPYGKEADAGEGKADTEDEKTVTERERIEYEIRSIASNVNEDMKADKVELPSSLETGEKISWEIEKSSDNNVLVIFALTAIMAFCIYRNRFAAMEKQRRENRESVIRQLPEFVNRLVLLLNAGLVLTSAFEKSIEEGIGFSNNDGDYFYGRMKEIYISSKTANGSMNREFRAMAKESGIRELMRISNIINDNVNKGVELTDKLQAESELLWMNRKKSCEEKGRLAETKLTLPLMIFLMVLIMITVAPALLEL